MTIKQRQHLLAYLGYYIGSADGYWGTLSKTACTAFQKDFGGIQVDGFGGEETDKALRHAVAYGMPEREETEIPNVSENEAAAGDSLAAGTFWPEIEHFSPEEFMCQCYKYTKYCDGWPHEMQELVVRICERTRKHFGQPITIISGLRCQQHNAAPYVGGHVNSQHMYGEAVDIYVWGVNPDTVLAYLQSQPDVRYAYRIEGTNNIHFDIVPVGR